MGKENGKVVTVSKGGFLNTPHYRGIDEDGRMKDTNSRRVAARFAKAGVVRRAGRRIAAS
jgi:hypothetical protein